MSDRDLLTFIRADQRRRWEGGTPMPVESYLTEHPALACEDESVLDLIYSEVLLREEFGEWPDPAEYARRFPHYADRLARQFEVHRLVGDVSSLTDETVATNATPLDTPDEPPDLPGYRVLRKLGEGSWGVVYEATHLALDHPVAVKLARAGAGSVLREAAAVIRIDSPHVVRVLDAGEHRGRAYFAMELVDGGSLAEMLGRPLPPTEAARLVLAVARGVSAAHALGIVHRDLKPANVLLTRDGTPKVADFGLARVPDAASSLVQSGATVGTEGYMAPEQAGDARGAGPTADVFALGVILHELLSGARPFRGAGLIDTVTKSRYEPAPPVRGLPAELDAIRLKCLEKRPPDRYATAAMLAADLDRWLHGQPTVARPRLWWRRVWDAIRRRAFAAAGLAFVSVAIGIGGGLPAFRWYADPLRRVERTLQKGETATLIGPNGPPEWHEWRQWGSDLELVDDGSGTVSFRATRLSLLVLLADPQHPRYRLTAEIRHLESPSGDGAIGVFVGFESPPAGEGWRADRWCGIEFSDYLTRGRAHKPTERLLNGVDSVAIAHADGTRDEAPQGVWTQKYAAPNNAIRLPPWRRFTLTVGPDEIQAEWATPDHPDLREPRPLPLFPTAATRGSRTMTHHMNFGLRFPTFRLVETRWDPRRPLGVYARRASLAVRNVVLEPLPYK